MNNAAIVCKIKNVRPHPNADRVQLGTACGYQVVIGLDIKEGDEGVYFPTDTRLGASFAEHNPELLTYFGKNLRVKTQKFRGERSEGFWVPVETISFLPKSAYTLGSELVTVQGLKVCAKYVNPATQRLQKKGKRFRSGSLPTFQKHTETDQLRRYWDELYDMPGDRIYTLKVHGTSGRTGHVLVDRKLSLVDRLLIKLGVSVQKTEYRYLTGSRNVILEKGEKTDSWYPEAFRERAAKPFMDNLHKGEVVYYEIVGYSEPNKPIMATVSVNDKELKKQYGDKVTYTYGCTNGQHAVYVYRIAYQTEQGISTDLTWADVKRRCRELGVRHVPEVSYLNEKDMVLFDDIEAYIDNPDPLDSSHPTEGIVLRIDGSTPKLYKEKSYVFKVLEGFNLDAGVVDIEEAS